MNIKQPIGPHKKPETMDAEVKKKLISELKAFPIALETLLANSDEEMFDTKTLLNVWTVRQVVHHLADSHMNAFIRTKLALTEDVPIIKPYNDNLWGNFRDANQAPVSDSISILKALHNRWSLTLESLTEEEWKKEFYHPDNKRKVMVEDVLSLYVWHGNHHKAHIENLYKEKGWKIQS